MEMNKFGSRYESNYERVVEKLIEVHSIARNTVQSRWGSMTKSLSFQNGIANKTLGYQYDTHYPGGAVKEIKHWLSPENVFNEQYVMRRTDRLEGTCHWAYDVGLFSAWLNLNTDSRAPSSEPIPPLLVSGKAGSGKSVLAAYLHHNLWECIRADNWSADDASRCSGSADTVDCQHSTVTGNRAVLYFPMSKSTKAASVIRTLIDQLLHFQPTNSGLQDLVRSKLTQRHIRECTSDVGVEILIELLRGFPSVQ
jgi:hypothetical protein